MKFEKVSRFADADFNLPVRKTKGAAGYDMEVAEDVIVPSYIDLLDFMKRSKQLGITRDEIGYTLSELAQYTKNLGTKPTLVSTGVKCKLNPGCYLELSLRSSTPLKYWLIMANGVGIIDADYYGNEVNDGEIFFQLINLSPFPIQLRKGDIIGQGIIKKYYIVDEDDASGERLGGFGSTTQLEMNSIDIYDALGNSKLQTFNLDEPIYIEYNCSLPEEDISNTIHLGACAISPQEIKKGLEHYNKIQNKINNEYTVSLAKAAEQSMISLQEATNVVSEFAKTADWLTGGKF